ncbi:hypothetical protein IMCC12053_1391 [Celeribacter marinus]|uniref:Uncharacterized protein n=1 Tax=Celeribacter marinus TaxID=1397108 RepID=A0A0N9ZHY5_9RHOB|nr:hypothetical protein IMCC12053_1391 [Celeribacter marinus]
MKGGIKVIASPAQEKADVLVFVRWELLPLAPLRAAVDCR